MTPFTAIIPAAGKGVRLMPYTTHMPKTMLSVAGKPILGHILDQVQECGIRRVVLIVGYKKEAIIEFVRERYAHLEVVFVEQENPKGLGHAIYLAKDVVTGPCFILLGDTIIDGDLKPLVYGGHNAVGVKRVPDPQRFGVVEMKDGKICSLVEKPENPTSDLALIGAYSFLESKRLFDALAEVISSGKTVKNEIQLTDALALLVSQGFDLLPVEMQDWFDCGTVDVLLQTNQLLLSRHHQVPAQIAAVNTVIEPCFIDEGARVENCVLGPYLSVAYGAQLQGCTLSDCIVGPQTKLHKKTASHAVFDKYGD